MLRFTTLSAIVTIAGTLGAQAASVVPLPAGFDGLPTTDASRDVAFNELCGPGSTPNNACETAVAEFQLGRKANYRNEIDARGAAFGSSKANLDPGFEAGVAEAFEIAYTAMTGELSVSVDRDGTPTTDTFTIADDRFADTRTLFLRLRSVGTGTATVSDLVIDGTAVGDLTVGGSGASERDYFAFTGLDGAADLLITGEIAFDFTTDNRDDDGNAGFAAQFKFTDLNVDPVPLPAGGLLLLGGLGALGALRARRTA